MWGGVRGEWGGTANKYGAFLKGVKTFQNYIVVIGTELTTNKLYTLNG